MSILHRAIAAALVLATFPNDLGAQVRSDSARADSSVYAIDGVVVRVGRPTATSGGVSAIEARLDSMGLGPAPTLEQALRALPLVQIRANSRGEAQLSLRGAESRQVAVLVDGVPLTLGWDHRTDLSIVPVAAAQSITLLRGLPSVLHGPNVLGGVVEVGVARGVGGPLRLPGTPTHEATIGVDHLGGRAVGVMGSRPFDLAAGELVLRAGAGYREQPDAALPGGVELPAAAPDDRRENSDLQQVDGFLALRYHREGGSWLSLSAAGFRAERGVPPELHTAEPRLWRYPEAERLFAALSAGTGQRRTPLGEGDLEASFGIDLGHTEIESYESRAYDAVAGTELADDRTVTLRLLGDHSLGSRGELRGAMTMAEIAHEEIIDDGAPANYRQRLWSLGGEVAWRLAPQFEGGWLAGTRVTGGVAYDGGDTPESGDKPPLDRLGSWGARLGINSVAPGGAVMLHAGISRRARFPSLRELYSGALGRFAPNPGLRPEMLTAGEAGVTATLAGVEVQAVAFHQRLADVIVRASTGDGRFRRENRDEMRSTGLELMTGWRLGPTGLTADLTWQRVRIVDPAAPSDESRAEYQPALAGSADWTVPLPMGVRAVTSARYMGRQWCVHPDLGREVALDPSTNFDLEIGRPWRRLDATVSLDNVTDAAVYDQCGLPQPGRTLRFQLRFR